MKIYTKWIKHLKGDDRQKEFLNRLMASKDVLNRLQTIIEEEIKSSSVNAKKKNSYSNPNWAYLQADNVGETRAYNQILKIISFEEN